MPFLTYILFADIIVFKNDLIIRCKKSMETFALAAISLTISISLFIKKKRSPVHLSFALLCSALFFQKGGVFFWQIFNTDFWKVIDYLGILSIPPLLLTFSRFFLNQQTFPPKKAVVSTASVSFLTAVALFTPLYSWPYLDIVLYMYVGSTLIYCFIALVNSIKEKTLDVEKKRLIYVAIACALTAAMSISDIFHHYGYGLPHLSNIAIATLIYFTLTIITHPHLPEFYEIMARALIIFVIILFATIVFYLVISLFGGDSYLPMNTVLMISFIIVIFIDPVKLILQKIVSNLFFEGRKVFTSLYAIDEEVERERSMLLEEMATGLAHEIRNPLGSIKGAAQYLRSEEGTTENRKLLDVIVEEVDRLSNVVSQFLNYAKPYTLNTKMQNINHIIEKATALIKANNLSENIIINENLSSDLPDVNVDGEQLMQVIINIAFNGIAAMPEGGTLSITTLKIENEDNKIIEIAIQDTGIGINKQDIKNIFKPFFTTREKGIGLGLSICQRIIKKHGGHLEVKSYPGQGTTFHIRLGVLQ